MNSNISTITCFAVLGVGVVCVGASSFYFFSKIHDTLQKELTNISASVSDIKRDISELKIVTKRKGLASGSSFSDGSSDIYYDFSDEAETSAFESDVSSDDGKSALVELHRIKKKDSLSEGQLSSRPASPVIPAAPITITPTISSSSGLKSKRSKHSTRSNLRLIDEILDNLAAKPNNYKQLYNKILTYHDKYFNRHDYLWRLAKACHLCGLIHGENGDQEKKKECLQEGLKHATTALALTDDDANVQKWYAICIGSCAEYETIQNKIKFGFSFKEHAELALQLNAADESLYYLMGRWCYEVAMMPWIERKVATTIFGEVPNATLAEARNYFLTAEKLHRTKGVWKENLLYLAKTYIGERNYTQAMTWLSKASNCEEGKAEDPLILKEIENLKTKYSSYCT